jgi:hypothetical protein
MTFSAMKKIQPPAAQRNCDEDKPCFTTVAVAANMVMMMFTKP